MTTSNPSALLDSLAQVSSYDTETLQQALDIIQQELHNRPDADILVSGCCVEDILEQRPDLTTEQCREVLRELADRYDAIIGINLDVIDFIADDCYPAPANLDELRAQAEAQRQG